MVKPFEWEESVQFVADYFKMKAEEVRRWSLIYFKYRSDFISHQLEKERNKSMGAKRFIARR